MSRRRRFAARTCALLLVTLALIGCVRCVAAPPTSSPNGSPTASPVGSRPRAAVITGAGLGTNLSGVTDWGTEQPFIDLWKTARPFVGGTAAVWDDGRKLDVDAHGWLRSLKTDQVAHTLMLTESGRYRPGRYLVRHQGKGELRFGGGARVVDAASRPGEIVLEVRPPAVGDTGITVDVVSVDAADPLRALSVIPPGGACAEDHARFCDDATPCASGACLSFAEHADALVFDPDFLARTRPYRMLRFMDLMHTNNSTIRRWSERPTVSDATWAARGVPVEVLIRLANETRAQPWFTIPHDADDAYVREFARALKDGVRPELRVWVEYSNEIWNALFKQHAYARGRGEELGLGDGFVAAIRYQARRSAEIFRIMDEVLGPARYVRVLAAQASNPWVAEEMLAFEGTAANVDAIAIAPYFGLTPGPSEREQVARLSVDELVAHTRTTLLPQVKAWTMTHAALAKKYGLALVAYEAGQHFVGVMGVEDDPRIHATFDRLNRDPRMRDLYLESLEDWRAAGGGWINHFVNCERWSKWGRWGALEYIRQPRNEAPKYDALMTFIERHPSGW